VRIVCLSAEAADICARLGAWEDVVAVTAFASQAGLAVRPIISGFSTADCDRVAALHPDLVICFSDVQADITAQLIRRGCTVITTNQRTLGEIADAIRLIGSAIGRATAAERLAAKFTSELDSLKCSAGSPLESIAEAAGQTSRNVTNGAVPSSSDSQTGSSQGAALRPRVYFEEWPDPLISAIGWVGELIEHYGGIDIFAARRKPASKDRVVELQEVIAANPDIIIASWCGRRVDIEAIRTRPGFAEIRAVKEDQIHAISSDVLLQPAHASWTARANCAAFSMRGALATWRLCRHRSALFSQDSALRGDSPCTCSTTLPVHFSVSCLRALPFCFSAR
jgi:iron complex transport system substrate-binding protein